MSVPGRLRRVGGLLDPGRLRFFVRKLRHPIAPGHLVVDVGSGGDPHPRADVIVDNSVDANFHRTVAFRRSAPTVVADVMALPFRDHAFDYSICSHVLEHLDDPAGAAAELSRISRAGYVETPSDIHEKLFPMTWHKWMVRLDGGRLRFEAKPSAMLDERLGDWFSGRWERDRSMMRFVWSHTDELFVQHHWVGRLDVETVGTPAVWFTPEEADEELQRPDAPDSSDAKRRVYDVAARFRYRRPRARTRARAR
ncbi:MAG: hypothetical protein QOH36_216 [Actinomycetota bacterium]|nr:hypothetical protein [Actinomycetota bacterium]